ncbi:MAG: ATP-dependent sacrificial sulfur transferase LarE [Myxococcota bacterium]|nr:ATP-dependent sacrificial sulfur transferase LarE [Myxococcota bacterium]
MSDSLNLKFDALQAIFQTMGKAVIAYSGGVDSAYLLKVAFDTLGDNAVAVTAISESYPRWERDEARILAETIGAKVIEINTDEIEREEYRKNAGDRCYFCKSELFSLAADKAQALNLGQLCYGAIPDDLGDHRPGMVAADEWAIRAPLVEVGLTKLEIRELSRRAGLPTWDKPASACLASRFPYGVEITRTKLQQVEACESALRTIGFRDFRARYHEHLVRIEFASDELARVLEDGTVRTRIIDACKSVGFKFVTIDLEGYRSGSANVLVGIDG